MTRYLLYLIVGPLSIGFVGFQLYEGLFSPNSANLVDQWKEVGLDASLLDPYLGPSCYENESSFAACHLAYDRMRVRISTPQEKKRPSLQQRFAAYKELYANINEKTQEPVDFKKLWSELKKELMGRDDVSHLISIGINSLLHLHRDPHTLLIPRSRFEKMVNENTRSIYGIGISIRESGNDFRVSRVLPNSPAEDAGLQVGDVVVSLDGRSLEGLSLDEVKRQLGLEDVEEIKVGVLSEGHGERSITLHKENLKFHNVTSELLSSAEGKTSLYLNIARFSKGVCKDVEHQLVSALKSNADDLILDLRGNPGGPLTEAACVADLFLPRGLKIFEVRYFDRSKPQEIYRSQVIPIFTYPVTTLIDAHTASAAELLAGALRDHERSVLVGERSYGKGSFQRGRVWSPYESAILLETLGLYYLPSGRSPQLAGLQPDLKMDLGQADVEREEGLFLNDKGTSQSKTLQNKGLIADLTSECLDSTSEVDPSSASQRRYPPSQDPVVAQASRVSDCLRAKGALADLGFSGGTK